MRHCTVFVLSVVQDEEVDNRGIFGDKERTPDPALGSHPWFSPLDPTPRSCPWVPPLVLTPRSCPWVPPLVLTPGSHPWFSPLDPTPRSCPWVPALDPTPGPTPGSHPWILLLILSSGSRPWIPLALGDGSVRVSPPACCSGSALLRPAPAVRWDGEPADGAGDDDGAARRQAQPVVSTDRAAASAVAIHILVFSCRRGESWHLCARETCKVRSYHESSGCVRR